MTLLVLSGVAEFRNVFHNHSRRRRASTNKNHFEIKFQKIIEEKNEIKKLINEITGSGHGLGNASVDPRENLGHGQGI